MSRPPSSSRFLQYTSTYFLPSPLANFHSRLFATIALKKTNSIKLPTDGISPRSFRDFGSFANLVKSAAGTGLFAMPNAFACVGLLVGIVGTALMGLLITGSLQLLVRIHHLMCSRLRQPELLYDEVVVATLTTGARKPWVSARVATYVKFGSESRYLIVSEYRTLYDTRNANDSVTRDTTLEGKLFLSRVFDRFTRSDILTTRSVIMRRK